MRQIVISKTTLIAIAVLLIGTLVSCREGDDTVDVVIKLLKDNGYQVGERSMKTVPFIWQRDGAGVDVNGEHIVIYQYDDEKALKSGEKAVREIVEAGSGYWDLPEGTLEEDIFYSRGVILVFLGAHSDTARLRELFDNSLRVKVITGAGANRKVVRK